MKRPISPKPNGRHWRSPRPPPASDRTDPVPDEIWDGAADHYDEQGLAALILMIATTNFFNRINITIREPAGATWG